MFRVLIVDDEPVIRKGLRNIVNWRSLGCEVAGEAEDGIQGREQLMALRPDILITDIRMPGMDGLAMVRQVRETLPDCRIVILTGYRDFEYLQEAIALGASEYLLKPTRIDALTAVLTRLTGDLRRQQDKQAELERLRSLYDAHIPLLREKFLQDLLSGCETDPEEVCRKMHLFGIQLGSYRLLLAENEMDENLRRQKDVQELQMYRFGMSNAFEEVFSKGYEVTSLALNDRTLAVILAGGDALEDEAAIAEGCAGIQGMMQDFFGFSLTVAVSQPSGGALSLAQCCRSCREALEHRFYLGSGAVIFPSDMSAFLPYQDHTLLEQLQKNLLEAVRIGNGEQVQLLLDTLGGQVSSGAPDREYLRNYYWHLISSIRTIRASLQSADQQKQPMEQDLSSLYSMVARCDCVQDLHELLRDAASQVAGRVQNFNRRSMKLVLRKAMEFIQSHYQEPLTLQDVADHVFVSTYYVSRIFKRELGKNFVDYLNEYRMEQACVLLEDISHKTYEVAEKVGIPDAHYFSKLFKKHVGLTPTEYRAKAAEPQPETAG